MKAIILFETKYGSTQVYSEWLSREMGYPAVHYKGFDLDDLHLFERIVIGSSVHMSKLDIAPWLKRHWKLLSEKDVILFSVNGTPPDDTNELQNILDYSLPRHIQEEIAYFPLQGRLVFSELNLWDKLLLYMLKRMNKQPAKNFVLEDYDNVKKENLTYLKRYLQKVEI